MKNIVISSFIAVILSVVILSIIRSQGIQIQANSIIGWGLYVVVFSLSTLFLKRRADR